MNWWTDERTEQVKSHAANHLSLSEIAEKLGCTRNAVAGKLHRIGVKLNSSGGATIVRRRPSPERRSTISRTRLTPAPAPPPSAAEPSPQQCTLLELTKYSCRWPMQEGFYCGAPEADINKSRPYCPAHQHGATTPYKRFRQ